MCNIKLNMPPANTLESTGEQNQTMTETKQTSPPVEDTEAASADEVKVYDEEEAEDERLEPASKALTTLSDDKSTLITESEAAKETSRGHHDLVLASKI